VAMGRTPFELNFKRYPWKENLVTQTDFPKIKEFLTGLQRSWEEATKSMEETKKNMKKKFNKKRRNPQGLKVGDNIWVEIKNIHLNRPSKKLNHKRYRLFRISKNIGQEVFQLELPEE